MDPRTRDAIRAIPKTMEDFSNRLTEMEKTIADIYKFTRSTNESVVRKYGGGKKNTVAKVVDKFKGDSK